MDGDQARATPKGSRQPAQRRTLGWYVAFIAISAVLIGLIYVLTGRDALGATARFVWSSSALAFDGLVRIIASLLGVLARGLGWRQLSRLSTVIGSVGLGYAGSAVFGDKGVRRAQGWRQRLRVIIEKSRDWWLRLPLLAKLAIVFVMIASQVYLHAVLILFPVAFLVPVVRRIWVQVADLTLGGWYWRTFGRVHRRVVSRLRQTPVARGAVGAIRVTRLRYLCAWRLWRYHPRYRRASSRRRLNLIEPLRLWRRGELDTYVGKPLLSGGSHHCAAPRQNKEAA